MTTLRWKGFSALGASSGMQEMVAGWLGGIASQPGTPLVIEMGEESTGPYFRALSAPEVLALGKEGGPPSLRGGEIPAWPVPLSPGPGESLATGRLVWGHPAEPAAPKPWTLFPHEEVRWGVQGIFRASLEGRTDATLRVGAVGPDTHAEAVRDRIGVRWAEALGEVYEPWVTHSRAGAIARSEWGARRVCRFHSGTETPPGTPLLASPWVAPGMAVTAVAGVKRWHLGQPWAGAPGGCVSDREILRHTCVLGMTGSGKTQFLAALAGEAVRNGVPFALFDLEGDLGPLAVSRVPKKDRDRIIVVDGARPWGTQRPGVDVLGGGARGRSEDLVVAQMLSALRPLSGSSEEFWGPRLERVLESVLRAVHSTQGTLADAASLLFDPATHAEALTKGLGSDTLRSFVAGIPVLNRRQPDYLASCQNRLSHVALSRVVRSLVAPEGRAVDIEGAIAAGRSLVFHLPKGAMGRGPSLFVANLLLANLYLSMTRRRTPGLEEVRTLVLLDEVQDYSPALLRGIAETGRKFGTALVLATQTAEHLEGIASSGTLGTVGTVVLLRASPQAAPRALSLVTGPTLPPEERRAFERVLSTLPDHAAIVRGHGMPAPETWTLPRPESSQMQVWDACSQTSADEFGNEEGEEGEGAVEGFLLDVASQARGGRRYPPAPGGNEGGAGILARELSRKHGWVVETEGGELKLTPSGWARLGARAESGAPRESEEHRRLVVETFRLFARHGVRLDIPAQGRFDVRVPDAQARQLPDAMTHPLSPREIREALDRVEGSWLWRLGHGRDVHVEAEVSGADVPLRLQRSLAKGQRAHAHVLFVTATSRAGEKVRGFLAGRGVGPDAATVWVLKRRR